MQRIGGNCFCRRCWRYVHRFRLQLFVGHPLGRWIGPMWHSQRERRCLLAQAAAGLVLSLLTWLTSTILNLSFCPPPRLVLFIVEYSQRRYSTLGCCLRF